MILPFPLPFAEESDSSARVFVLDLLLKGERRKIVGSAFSCERRRAFAGGFDSETLADSHGCGMTMIKGSLRGLPLPYRGTARSRSLF